MLSFVDNVTLIYSSHPFFSLTLVGLIRILLSCSTVMRIDRVACRRERSTPGQKTPGEYMLDDSTTPELMLSNARVTGISDCRERQEKCRNVFGGSFALCYAFNPKKRFGE